LGFIFLQPLKGNNSQMIYHKNWKWVVLGVLELIAVVMWPFQDSNRVTTLLMLDICILILQFLYHRYEMEHRVATWEAEHICVEEQRKEFKNRDLKIQNDIYSLAFAACVNPNLLDSSPEAKGKNYLQRIDMTQNEAADVYQCAMIVAAVQIVTIILIIEFFYNEEALQLTPAKNFVVIIPRLMSSIMMHLNVEPDIRNGLNLMKYVVNHPQMFSSFRDG